MTYASELQESWEQHNFPTQEKLNQMTNLAEQLEDDARRLDWLEQLTIPDEDITDLVRNWRVDGKKYPRGIREAIDAAMKKWP